MTWLTLDPYATAAIFAAIGLGGMLKGATGAGAPVIAVPVIAAVFDIRTAIVVMVMPNMLSNLWQIWQFRAAHLPERFSLRFALAGGLGAGVGTVLLASLPAQWLTLAMAAVVFFYVGLRLAKPGLKLPFETAGRWVVPAGSVGGLLQGAAGLSAPVAVTFVNAMRLSRPAFAATVSAYFVAMSVVQFPTMLAFGLMSGPLFLTSLVALVPMILFMPVGAWLGRRMSPAVFDRVLLVFLTLVAVRLVVSQAV